MSFRSPRRIALASTLALALPLGACSDDDGPGPGTDATSDVAGDVEPMGDAEVNDDTTVLDVTDTGDTAIPEDTPPDTTPDVVDPNPIPPVDVAPDPNLCSPIGGGVNVFDLQNPECPDHMHPEPEGSPGVYVELEGLVITANFGDTFFAQDPRGGPYSGITIFAHGDYRDEAVPGSVVNITGNYSEFFENTQVYLTTLEVTGTTFMPAPYEALHPAHIMTNGPLAEMFESVLVRVVDVSTTHTQPDCPFDFGEFEVGGGLRIDDMGFKWEARLGDRFESITGPLNFSFGNHKIEPRDEADIVATAVGAPTSISKCIAEECQAPAEMSGTRQVIINEIMPDPMGSDTNQEWIELYNPGDAPVNVQGWTIRDCATQMLTLSGPQLEVPARGYLVVGMSNNPSTNGGADVDLAYGNSSYYMPNTIGGVLLYDGPGLEATLVDQTRYSRFGDWTSIFRSGHSLERKGPNSDGTVPDGWGRGRDEYGSGGNFGTPGARNDAR